MKIEELIAMGLSEEQAKAVHQKYGSYVPKSRLDEVISAKKGAEEVAKEWQESFEKLKQGKSEEIRKEIDVLKQEHDAKVLSMKRNFAIETALTKSGARNNAAVRGLFGNALDEVKFEGDTLVGFDEMLEKIKKENPWAFETGNGSNFKAGIEQKSLPEQQGRSKSFNDAEVARLKKSFTDAQKSNDIVSMTTLTRKANELGIDLY